MSAVGAGTPCPCGQGVYEKCRGGCGGWRCYACDYEGSSATCDTSASTDSPQADR